MGFDMVKYILGSLLMPVPLIIFCSLLGVLITLFNPASIFGRFASAIGVIMLFAISTKPFADVIVSPLEFKYPALTTQTLKTTYKDLPTVDNIVVLGCGHNSYAFLPESSYLRACARIRITEGIRLAKLFPDAKIFVSGNRFVDQFSHAKVLSNALQNAGISAQRIKEFPQPYDTFQESVLIAPHIVDDTTLLVTSAMHMQRAKTLFEQQGIDIIPAPTDFQTRRPLNDKSAFHWIPNSKNIERVTLASHEYLGLAWMGLKTYYAEYF